MKPKIPYSWLTEKASTCFSKSYNGEGSYYCPGCQRNLGSVWADSDWRPTKAQAFAECDGRNYADSGLYHKVSEEK